MSGTHARPPPPHINVTLDPNRDSRFESAQEANDIFALYGRDSWALSDTASLQEPQLAAASHSDLGSPRLAPHRANGGGGDHMEQLDSDEELANASPPRPSFETAQSQRPDFSRPRPGLDTLDSPRSGTFNQGDGIVHAQPYHPGGGWGDGMEAEHEHIDRRVPATPPGNRQFVRPPSENPQPGPAESLNSHYSSMGQHESVSMDHQHHNNSPYSPYSGAGSQAHSDQYHDARSGGDHSSYSPSPASPPNGAARSPPPLVQTPSPPSTIPRIPPPSLPPHLRTPERLSPPSASTGLSPPSASAGSAPVHPSIARLNGRVLRNGPPASPTSAGDHSMSLSQASLVSSQYPGEDDEAFHVRSTYARLEVEGVYGDGWDEGVERTRGGANNAGRVTMVFPEEPGEISEQERAFLASLDRYGFVDVPAQSRAEGRLVLVPASPFGKVPRLKVKSGAKPTKQPPPPPPPASNGHPPSPPVPPPNGPSRMDRTRARKKEEERVMKWLQMMSVDKRDSGGNVTQWRWSSTDGAKHPKRIYKGIPDRWRMAAWWTLAEQRAARASRKQPAEALESDYAVRKEQPSANDVQIDLDVPRTISGHALFKTRFGHGQRALFHVLHAFSQTCGTCGYCQGMGSVAATLLCYFAPERAYTLMVRLHDLYDMHGIFAPGFPGLLETFYVQERLLEHLMPDVYASFQRNMISSTAWGTKIYITLFVNVVPFNTQLRLWDALFLDGYDVMVLAVLGLLWAYRPLLAHKHANFESILSLLSSYFVLEDEDAYLEWMRKVLHSGGVREQITNWRREWRGLVARGEEQGILL